MKREEKHFVLVTTTHICNNPRLVKELSVLNQLAKLTVIFFQFDKKKIQFDCEIINQFSEVMFISVNWTKNYNPERVFYTFITKTLKYIHKKSHVNIWAEQQLWIGSFKLFQKLKEIKADLYHGHNLGTLVAVVKVAKNKNSKCSFDAEDFHRGEYLNKNINQDISIAIENLYIPKLDLLLSASPLITKEYKQLFPAIQHLTINNYFPFNPYKNVKQIKTKNLKLVWFSQVVGLDRGLQTILSSINVLNFEVDFDIIGAYTPAIFKQLTKICSKNINFIGLLSPASLEKKLVEYNIGFASEPGKDFNNNIALSNKIFSYLQAGLAIIASNTKAQLDFFKSYNGIGFIYKINHPKEVLEILSKLHHDRKLLFETQSYSARLSETLNWENEQKKLKSYLEKII